MSDPEARLRAALLEAIEHAEAGAKLLAWSEHGRKLRALADKWRALLAQLETDQADQAAADNAAGAGYSFKSPTFDFETATWRL